MATRLAGAAAILTAAIALPALAAEVAPEAVVFAGDGSVAESLSGAPGDAAAGAKSYSDRALGNCAACHANPAQPDVPFQGNIGPSLEGAGSRWSEAQLRGIVADAKHTFPDTMMPSFYKVSGYIRPGEVFTSKPAAEPLPPIMNAQQIEDMVAYLASLK